MNALTVTVELNHVERMLLSIAVTEKMKQEMAAAELAGEVKTLPPRVLALENILFKIQGLEPLPSP
jgi:hypothetical protein